MIKIITINVNGIRSAARKGFFAWLVKQDADVICLQELKAQAADLAAEIFQIPGYHRYLNCAHKKGYSGVAIYSKREPAKLQMNLGWPTADEEGRYLEADFGAITVISLYMPSGTSGPHRQVVKFDFLDRFARHLAALRKASREFIICGDWNIAHREIDLKNWKGNLKNTGFLPEERAWMDTLFGPLGYVDAFREINQEPEQYTWWSQRGQARAKNVGWRIDYQVVTPGLKKAVKSVAIYTAERFSDHAPLTIDYQVNF
jgi:exodeoxyribonuclease-3